MLWRSTSKNKAVLKRGMMISGPSSCYRQGLQGVQTYGATENMISSSSSSVISATPETDTHSNALLYNLSVLRYKVQQVQSLLDAVVLPDQRQDSMAIAGVGTLIQEIITTASSMMYTCQKMSLDAMVHGCGSESHPRATNLPNGGSAQPSSEEINHAIHMGESGKGFFNGQIAVDFDNCHTYNNYDNSDDRRDADVDELQRGVTNCNVIELDAADLLAEFTHYCHVCGKGFKRDANLRMHMRAHGDQYKSNAALSNPRKNSSSASFMGYGEEDCSSNSRRKYSCPQEGCRWNRKHAKFQPLKSMICAKNHYKRSHCPRMYVCNRCSQKQFSLLSDLRTHEKHCGDLKWQCSCGTTFSRKDKLAGHLALFVGHAPAMNCPVEPEPAKIGC